MAKAKASTAPVASAPAPVPAPVTAPVTTAVPVPPVAPPAKTPEELAKEAQEKAEKVAAKAKEKADAKAAKEAEKATKAKEKEDAKVKAKADADAAKAAKVAQKLADKEAAKVAKTANQQPQSNMVRRPKPETLCGKAWDIFDAISAQTRAPATISASLEVAKAQGLNEGNVRSEYARWRKFNGVVGRLEKAPVSAAPSAPATEPTAQ